MTYAICAYCWPFVKDAEVSSRGRPHKKCKTLGCECKMCHKKEGLGPALP